MSNIPADLRYTTDHEYVKTSADLNSFYRWWDEMFAYLAELDVKPIASDSLIAAAWATR